MKVSNVPLPGASFAKALGLDPDRIKRLEISFHEAYKVEIVVTFLPDEEQLAALEEVAPVLSKFRLIAIEEAQS